MSEVEHYTGKLVSTGKNIETYKREKLEHYNGDEDDWLFDHERTPYASFGGVIYEALELKKHNDREGVFESVTNKDGTIGFNVSFYNGGLTLEDAIEESLKGKEPIENSPKIQEEKFLELIYEAMEACQGEGDPMRIMHMIGVLEAAKLELWKELQGEDILINTTFAAIS